MIFFDRVKIRRFPGGMMLDDKRFPFSKKPSARQVRFFKHFFYNLSQGITPLLSVVILWCVFFPFLLVKQYHFLWTLGSNINSELIPIQLDHLKSKIDLKRSYAKFQTLIHSAFITSAQVGAMTLRHIIGLVLKLLKLHYH